MIRVLFICNGNICRSPMAEYIMKDIVSREGKGADDSAVDFQITSAATSREEIGNDIYPPAKRMLDIQKVKYDRHQAHQVTAAEMDEADYVLIMDERNRGNLARLFGADFERKYAAKTHLLMEFADGGEDGAPREIPDPWYSGDFNAAYNAILAGCEGLLACIKPKTSTSKAKKRPST